MQPLPPLCSQSVKHFLLHYYLEDMTLARTSLVPFLLTVSALLCSAARQYVTINHHQDHLNILNQFCTFFVLILLKCLLVSVASH